VSETGQDLLAWAHAKEHLEGALGAAAAFPRLRVHAAYYAVFHAARACLLRCTGSAPKKHASVVRQFGLLVKDRPPVVQAGRDLNWLRVMRRTADYSDGAVLSAEQAARSVETAASFLALCAAEFGFPLPNGQS
jgi:uncharacterized protein (UPF0332 family)